jgi:hypothetical protein
MDYIRPTPRNPIYGLLADQLEKLYSPTQTQQMQGLMKFLMVPEVSKTMNLLAYDPSGRSLFTGAGGIGGTTKPKPEVADAAMAVAPFVPATGRAARGVARMAGQEIADVMSGMPSRSLLGDITPKPMQLITYHGTPHKFPPTQKNLLGEFDASKIGTGEGAQSYGYGIYVAENPSVAQEYVVQRNWFDTSKATYKGKPIDYWYEKAQKDQDIAFRTKNKALEEDAAVRLGYWENVMTHTNPKAILKTMTDPDYGWEAAAKYAKSIDLNKFKGIPESGGFYKVDLPDDKIAKMLDWDKPLSKQSPEVQAAIEKLTGIRVDKKLLNEYDDALYNALQGGSTDLPKQPIDPKGSDLLRMIGKNDKETAQRLQEQGIPGVKYFDAGSRDEKGGTRNFVVFPGEEKNMRILERDGEKAPFQFPQQAALDTAQKNAALPISEGGLGLPPNNTPMDRAKAIGFDTDVYHATDAPQDFSTFTPSVKGKMGSGVYTSFEPAYAERYAGGETARTMPLMSRGEMANVDTRTEVSDLVRQQLANENPNFNIQEWKRLSNQELGNRGYSGLDVDKERLVFNPSDLRSRFAAFDPMRRNESDILAGLLPASLLADPETRRKLDEELSLLYTK